MTNVLVRRGHLYTEVCAEKKDHVKIQGEDGHLQSKGKALRRNQTFWYFDIGRLASNIMRKHTSVLYPNLWCFVVAALVNQYIPA